MTPRRLVPPPLKSTDSVRTWLYTNVMTARQVDYELASEMLLAGETHAQVADHFGVTAGAIDMAVSRGLVESARKAPRVMPWALKPEHRHLHEAHVIRLALRILDGRPPANVRLRQRGESLISRLAEAGEVIDYRPRRRQPFVRVPARPGEDVVRRPEKKAAA